MVIDGVVVTQQSHSKWPLWRWLLRSRLSVYGALWWTRIWVYAMSGQTRNKQKQRGLGQQTEPTWPHVLSLLRSAHLSTGLTSSFKTAFSNRVFRKWPTFEFCSLILRSGVEHTVGIWVSFCRTGKIAVLCLIFEEKKVEDNCGQTIFWEMVNIWLGLTRLLEIWLRK